ncbi:MAG: sensor histidine kinase, partial [Ruminococcus sp.]|nr:sensor histidine kinase [Ruminococcus sp.]
MKTYKRFCAVIIALFLAVVLSANIKLIKSSSDTEGMYLIEAKRLTDRIDRDGGFDGDLSDFDYIIKVIPEDECEDIYISNEPYVIIRSGDKLYRAEYRTENSRINTAVILNLGFAACLVLLAVTLFSVKKQVIEPFTRINDVPQELAKGNLAVPIPAEKSKVFGKFTWGVEMLRETIEDSRRKELDMQRDK